MLQNMFHQYHWNLIKDSELFSDIIIPVLNSDFQTVVVGFLCQSKEIKNFKDNSWIEIEGEITKGDYHGEIPIIKIKNIKECVKPNDEFVYPPDENFIPTSSIL